MHLLRVQRTVVIYYRLHEHQENFTWKTVQSNKPSRSNQTQSKVSWAAKLERQSQTYQLLKEGQLGR